MGILVDLAPDISLLGTAAMSVIILFVASSWAPYVGFVYSAFLLFVLVFKYLRKPKRILIHLPAKRNLLDFALIPLPIYALTLTIIVSDISVPDESALHIVTFAAIALMAVGYIYLYLKMKQVYGFEQAKWVVRLFTILRLIAVATMTVSALVAILRD